MMNNVFTETGTPPRADAIRRYFGRRSFTVVAYYQRFYQKGLRRYPTRDEIKDLEFELLAHPDLHCMSDTNGARLRFSLRSDLKRHSHVPVRPPEFPSDVTVARTAFRDYVMGLLNAGKIEDYEALMLISLADRYATT